MLVIGEPTGEDNRQVVTYRDELIGHITNLSGAFVAWKPIEEMPFDMNIGETVAFQAIMIVDYLEHLTDRQFKSFMAGGSPDTNTLHPELRPYLTDTAIGKSLRHPLYFDVMYNPVMNAQTNYIFKIRAKDAEQHLAGKRWRDYVWHHERPYRLDAFLEVHHRLPHSQFWPMLSSLWRDSENIWQNEDMWRMLLESTRPMRDRIMDASERKAFAAFPDDLTIYRGVHRRDRIRGLSWTINKEKAEWFARRYSHPDTKPILATATVKKSDVLAYFAGRSESEIVILPEKLGKITTTPVSRLNREELVPLKDVME